jgi:hypothetical protein
MTAANCHSDDRRNLFVIPTEKFFSSTRNLLFISTRNFYFFDRERFFSREKLLQNDTCEMSFRQRSFFSSTRNFLFISTRIFMFSIGRDSSVAKSSFRMTLAKCHSDREVFLLRRGIFFYFNTDFLRFRQLRFFSREKFLQNDRESLKKLLQNDTCEMSFRQRSFLLRRGIFLFQDGFSMFSIGRDSSVAEKLLQNDTYEMSFRR